MNVTSAKPRSLSAREYILALHEPDETIAVLLRNRNRGQTLQRIALAETVASPDFQRWLSDQNRAGSDIFVGMNPLKNGACSRTKDNLKEIRHVYLDLDEDAEAALADIHDSLDAPTPNFVLNSSPGKHQVVWKIEGLDTEQAEILLRSLANRFGGDPAATDATRVLRLPEFVNRKYGQDSAFVVRVRQETAQVYSLRDFTVQEDSPEAPRKLEDGHSSTRALARSHKSQSEADWAFAKRALTRGDDPEQVIRRIADYRADDKHDPDYYARRTVAKAQLQLAADKSPSTPTLTTETNSPETAERLP
jgi:hypothetical protein